MKEITFSYSNARISKTELEKTLKRLTPEIKKINKEIQKEYDTEYAAMHLPNDTSIITKVNKALKEKDKLNPVALFHIGQGGSSLGNIAVHQFLNGKLYNEENPKRNLFILDNIDPDYTTAMLKHAESLLKQNKNILVHIVSKSGTTTEAIVNGELFRTLLKKYKKKDHNKFILCTAKNDVELYNIAEKNNYQKFVIPHEVGGRYSVLTALGLLAFAYTKNNNKKIQAGAKAMQKRCLSENLEENPAAMSAALIYLQNKKGCNINDNFLFSSYLEGFGKWYRQLISESIGKTWNKKHTKKIHVGITPTVAVGSTDLHSMAQLNLGGPRDKFTCFYNIEEQTKIKVPSNEEVNAMIKDVGGKELKTIMNAIYNGTTKAYMKDKRPFMEVTIPKRNEHAIAELLFWKMIEMIYLAFLLDVDPFDQPSVEKYKFETRQILQKK